MNNKLFYISMYDQVKLGLSVQRPVFMANPYDIKFVKCPAYGYVTRGKIIVQGKVLIIEKYRGCIIFEVSVFETIMYHNKNKSIKPVKQPEPQVLRRAKRIKSK